MPRKKKAAELEVHECTFGAIPLGKSSPVCSECGAVKTEKGEKFMLPAAEVEAEEAEVEGEGEGEE